MVGCSDNPANGEVWVELSGGSLWTRSEYSIFESSSTDDDDDVWVDAWLGAAISLNYK